MLAMVYLSSDFASVHQFISDYLSIYISDVGINSLLLDLGNRYSYSKRSTRDRVRKLAEKWREIIHNNGNYFDY